MASETQTLSNPQLLTSKSVRRRRQITPYLFISPFYILFLIFFFVPTLYALFLSFQRWNTVTAPEFMGLRNYERLLTDRVFLQAIENTLTYSAASLLIVCPLALLLALALNSNHVWFKTF